MTRVGIDASNISAGGGVTYLKELLRAAEPNRDGIKRVVIWSEKKTLDQLPDRHWLYKVTNRWMEGNLLSRLFWQKFLLPRAAGDACDVLFVPGGNYRGNFRPYVAISITLLPFDNKERRKYGLSWKHFRLSLLKHSQTATFQNADGMIFLTHTARRIVESETGALGEKKPVEVIPFGIADEFFQPPKAQQPLANYSHEKPFRWLYVSSVQPYKHQCHVVKAMEILRRDGLPVTLDLIGPAFPKSLARLQREIHRADPKHEFIHYRGEISYADLPEYYQNADTFLFASSCENLPNILLEAMGAGLPIACSNVGPMPEILKQSGMYFNPEDPVEIAETLRELMSDPQKRADYALKAHEEAKGYSWSRCARDTLVFLANIAENSSSEKLKSSTPIFKGKHPKMIFRQT